MCSVGPSRGGAFTKLGEIGEFGERYALQGPLEGVVSPNDLEQRSPARKQRPPGRPAPLPAAETGHTLANPCHPRQRKRGDRVSGGAEAQRGDSPGCACEAARA